MHGLKNVGYHIIQCRIQASYLKLLDLQELWLEHPNKSDGFQTMMHHEEADFNDMLDPSGGSMEIFAVSTGVDTCNSLFLRFDVLFGALVAGDELVVFR